MQFASFCSFSSNLPTQALHLRPLPPTQTNLAVSRLCSQPFLFLPLKAQGSCSPSYQSWLVNLRKNVNHLFETYTKTSSRPTSRLSNAQLRSGPLGPLEEDRQASAFPGRWEDILSIATSLYPVYVLAGGVVAIWNPSAFDWFVSKGPASYSLALASIMLATGLSLRLEDLFNVFLNRPLAVIFGFAAQYLIMPVLGLVISRLLNLPPAFSVGLILLSCCPGGTASNVVTYIARGDVPLSVVMTVCTTFASVFMTPLLTPRFAGAYVPVNASALALSTLQVVFAPVVLGAWLQSSFPKAVTCVIPFLPLVAVLISSLLASSVFSANVGLLGSVIKAPTSLPASSDLLNVAVTPSVTGMPSVSSNSVLLQLGQVAVAVFLVHAFGFLFGYLASCLARFGESQRRAISIEVGMQNSSLGVVLATSHFSSPLTAVPAAVSAVLMNIMGSALGVWWRRYGQVDSV